MKQIDIIASVFNSDIFLEGYFIDITKQTFFKNCSLTLVAPNPSDKLISITNIYSKMFDNINLISLKEDPGVSECLNIALRKSYAPYITIANTDDRKRKDSLERHWLELELNPNIDLVYGSMLLSTVPNETFDFNTCKYIYPAYEFDGLSGLLKHNSPHASPMWRRTIHSTCGYFDNNLISAADHDMWIRSVIFNKSKFKYIKEILGIYYYNPDGKSTNQEKLEERSKEELMVREKYSKYL